MTIEEAIELIFSRLCGAYTRNPDTTMTAEDLGTGIPNDVFAAALRELRGPADDQDLRIRYVEGIAPRPRWARRGAAGAKRGDADGPRVGAADQTFERRRNLCKRGPCPAAGRSRRHSREGDGVVGVNWTRVRIQRVGRPESHELRTWGATRRSV